MIRSRLPGLALAFACGCGMARPGSAQVIPPSSPHSNSQVPLTLPVPAGVHRADWLLLGGAAASGLLFDPWLREEIHTEGEAPFAALSRVGGVLGNPAIMFPSLGLAYGIGKVTGRPALAHTAFRAGEAILAASLVTEGIKVLVGRGRPYAVAPDRDDLRPGSFSADHQSFPSGHTTAAFALATALAWNSSSPWAVRAAYSGAALVGLSRLRRDAHWGSDVLAGALVGTLSARLTLGWLDQHGRPKAEVLPSLGGVSVSIPFR